MAKVQWPFEPACLRVRFSASLNLAKALPQNPHGAIASCYG